jgi:hypothetical protein
MFQKYKEDYSEQLGLVFAVFLASLLLLFLYLNDVARHAKCPFARPELATIAHNDRDFQEAPMGASI